MHLEPEMTTVRMDKTGGDRDHLPIKHVAAHIVPHVKSNRYALRYATSTHNDHRVWSVEQFFRVELVSGTCMPCANFKTLSIR